MFIKITIKTSSCRHTETFKKSQKYTHREFDDLFTVRVGGVLQSKNNKNGQNDS